MADMPSRLTAALADRYRVERELGAGGMATVYLAQDIRHDRKVALKLLKPELAAVIGAERFLQEIKTTANLQHPHILGLIDSGETEGLLWYVMPLVEGESLRDRLTREKQLPIEDALRLAGEVASALDYAHRRGVIHRDIKPENILLHDNRALVADFGIALAVSSAGSRRMTETGMSLGTPQYMSPEQAMGDRALDARSDVYSLSAMLYEMLAGDPPYTGSNAQAIVAKVLTEKPPLVTSVRDTVPPQVAGAIYKALAKLPADRFQSAAEFAAALQDGKTAGRYDGTMSFRTATVLPSYRLPVLVGVLALAAGLALGWILHRSPVFRTFPAEFYVEADSTHTMELGTFVPLALSPDGSRLAYLVRTRSGGVQLYERKLGERDARPVAGTESADHPFYSPDGEWIAFDDGGLLKKVRLAGGAATIIARIDGSTTGGAWGPDGTIVFSSGGPRKLFQVSADGGTPEQLTTPDSAGGDNHVRPVFLPDGKTVLFSSFRSGTATARLANVRLGVLSLPTRRVQYREVPALIPKYLSSGELLYALDDGSLVAQRFDLKRFDVTGPVRRVVDAVSAFARVSPTFDASPSGVIVYRPGGGLGTSLVSVDRQGKEQTLLTVPDLWSPRIAPDGDRIAFARGGGASGGRDLWVYSVREASSTRITHEFANSVDPAWNAAGSQLLFSAGPPGAVDLYEAPADGGAPAQRVLERPGNQYQPLFTRDGHAIVFVDVTPNGRGDLFTLSRDPGASPAPLVQTSFDETAPALSPDGKWLAYHSDESGQVEVYVRTFPGPGPRAVISSGGGREPAWNPKGQELFYRTGTKLMAATLETGATVTVRSRTPLFDLNWLPGRSNRNYDVHPDGNHFLFIKTQAQQRLVVRLNALAPEPR